MIGLAIVYLGTWFYSIVRPLIFRQSAQSVHDWLFSILVHLDNKPFLCWIAKQISLVTMRRVHLQVGGVVLDYPFILAAGFVKGLGFQTEQLALEAVEQNINIIPGWKFVPNLLNIVEFGSFTRFPRLGNFGTVVWRNTATHSTQNRIGLRNPGAVAAATFLAKHRQALPACFGINIAVNPEAQTSEQELNEVLEAFDAFIARDILPAWFTLNISCPNTEADPTGNQTEQKTRYLCQNATDFLKPYGIPLWVKISPDLAPNQYHILMHVFTETHVNAVIATNTIGKPTPNNSAINGGIGGGDLHLYAIRAVEYLVKARNQLQSSVDIIGCGGIMNGDTYRGFQKLGVQVVQYWSVLVYRGIFAPQIIQREAK